MPQTRRGCFSKILLMPWAALLIFAAAACAIIFGFTMQYGFGLKPCVLCLWQRVPFGLAAALAVTALVWRPSGARVRILLGLCAAVFFVNMGLALFHTGVEKHWWLGTSGCSIQPLTGATPEDLRTQLLNTAVVSCDQVTWTFLGLSMANWNILYSLFLAMFALAAMFYESENDQ
ncbi:MAG: disulfide bond formation protein B [Alphaproteobacteria bacterium]|nr:disulfide bond formation protein B [Alphaproteobacteria bacterium]